MKQTYYKRVRRQSKVGKKRPGKFGVIFLPRKLIGKRIKVSIEVNNGKD